MRFGIHGALVPKPKRGRAPSTVRLIARECLWCWACRHTVAVSPCSTCGSGRLDVVVKRRKVTT